MAMHLITGHSGTAHISAADDGALNAAIVGDGSYVFDFGDDFAATMTTANSVTIGTGALVHQGRKAWCSTSTQLTVESGTQAQRRHDLVVARYTKTGDVEDMQLAVVKGTPVSYGDPSDPEHEDGSVIDGATVSDFPLWRIPIDGITPGTPVRLFDVTPSLAELRDSVSQQDAISSAVWPETLPVTGTRVGRTVQIIVTGRDVLVPNGALQRVATLAAGCRPEHECNVLIGVSGSAWLLLRCATDGGVYLFSQYGSGDVTIGALSASATFVAEG